MAEMPTNKPEPSRRPQCGRNERAAWRILLVIWFRLAHSDVQTRTKFAPRLFSGLHFCPESAERKTGLLPDRRRGVRVRRKICGVTHSLQRSSARVRFARTSLRRAGVSGSRAGVECGLPDLADVVSGRDDFGVEAGRLDGTAACRPGASKICGHPCGNTSRKANSA